MGSFRERLQEAQKQIRKAKEEALTPFQKEALKKLSIVSARVTVAGIVLTSISILLFFGGAVAWVFGNDNGWRVALGGALIYLMASFIWAIWNKVEENTKNAIFNHEPEEHN